MSSEITALFLQIRSISSREAILEDWYAGTFTLHLSCDLYSKQLAPLVIDPHDAILHSSRHSRDFRE